jgi:hypothetical protein
MQTASQIQGDINDLCSQRANLVYQINALQNEFGDNAYMQIADLLCKVENLDSQISSLKSALSLLK